MYSFDHIIDECVVEKVSTIAPEAKRGMYVESFAALNSWVESRLRRRKGAEIGSFGTFTWEIRTEEDGDIKMRPLFLIADSFVKSHRVRQQRIHYFPKTATNEEINYSKLAIKFSKSLTKDMVFSSLRDIIRKIGDFVSRGYELEIPFSFGVLTVKERRVKFEFTSSDIAIGGEEEIIAETLDNAASPCVVQMVEKQLNVSKEVPETTRSAESRPSSARRFLDNFDNSNNLASEIAQTQPEKSKPIVPPLSLTDEATMSTAAKTSEPPSARLVELLLPLEPRTEAEKTEFSAAARNHCVEQAFLRCLEDLERQTMNEDYTKYQAMKQTNEWKSSEAKKQEDFAKTKKELNDFLDSQVHEFEARQAQARIDRRNAEMKTIIPGSSDPRHVSMSKGELCHLLQTQIQNREVKMRTMKEKQMQEERDYLDHISIELDMQHTAERAAHLSKQSAMLEAWEREAHVRNLKKLQTSGLAAMQSYIRQNLDVTSTYTSARDEKRGIGFDRRKTANQTSKF